MLPFKSRRDAVHYGQWKAGHLHVLSTRREVARAVLSSITSEHRRDPAKRLLRRAYTEATWRALQGHRRLCREFAL